MSAATHNTWQIGGVDVVKRRCRLGRISVCQHHLHLLHRRLVVTKVHDVAVGRVVEEVSNKMRHTPTLATPRPSRGPASRGRRRRRTPNARSTARGAPPRGARSSAPEIASASLGTASVVVVVAGSPGRSVAQRSAPVAASSAWTVPSQSVRKTVSPSTTGAKSVPSGEGAPSAMFQRTAPVVASRAVTPPVVVRTTTRSSATTGADVGVASSSEVQVGGRPSGACSIGVSGRPGELGADAVERVVEAGEVAEVVEAGERTTDHQPAAAERRRIPSAVAIRARPPVMRSRSLPPLPRHGRTVRPARRSGACIERSVRHRVHHTGGTPRMWFPGSPPDRVSHPRRTVPPVTGDGGASALPRDPFRRRRRSHDPPEGGTQKESARMDRDKSLDMTLGQIEKQFGKGAIMRLGERGNVGIEAIPTGALALDLALGIGGLPAWPDRRDLRPGVVREVDARDARGRRGPAQRRRVRLHRRRARDGPGLRGGHRRERRRPADLPARHGGAGARDRRHADPLGRARRARDRLGRRAGAPRRDRGRDGRHATSASRPGS